jgi:hypothetical protein
MSPFNLFLVIHVLAAAVGAMWLAFILASIILVAVILFVVCLVCYRYVSVTVFHKFDFKYSHQTSFCYAEHIYYQLAVSLNYVLTIVHLRCKLTFDSSLFC